MRFTLPKLPFESSALAPRISAETIELHHGKHHQAYVDKLNQLIAGTEYEAMPLEQITRRTGRTAPNPIFNQAGQHWNHSFYWQCLSPAAQEPDGELLARIKRDFGSMDAFKTQFTKAAVEHFASGWAWLALEGGRAGKLAIRATHDADTPLAHDGQVPLLCCDLWEHAYYVDYRNDRKAFVEASWSLLRWEFAADNLAAALGAQAA